MTEPKPPVKGELPDVIYAWMGFQDNGSWDRTPCPCTSHESVKYVRADKSVVIPAADFGRILRELDKALQDYQSAYDVQSVNSVAADSRAERMAAGARCDSVLMPRIANLRDVLALARKYGSAE